MHGRHGKFRAAWFGWMWTVGRHGVGVTDCRGMARTADTNHSRTRIGRRDPPGAFQMTKPRFNPPPLKADPLTALWSAARFRDVPMHVAQAAYANATTRIMALRAALATVAATDMTRDEFAALAERALKEDDERAK